MTYSILNLLQIKDPNIKIIEEYEPINEVTRNEIPYQIISAQLSYTPYACEKCGIINDNYQVQKHGFHKPSFIKLGKMIDKCTLLKLRKQRYKCQECGQTFIASSPIVDKHCFISNKLKDMLYYEAGYTQSMTDIADRYAVSLSTVIRRVDQAINAFDPAYRTLPTHLCFDECMTTEEGLSFVCIDAQTHEIVDILPGRKQSDIRAYFQRYSLELRQKVVAVTTDMYAPYEKLIPELFPQAVVVTDRFHIVQHLNVALNRIRIEVMNSLRYTQPRDYKKLKDLWKLLLKNREELDFDHYYHHPLFDGLVTEKMIVNYLISLSPRLTQTYEVINNLKLSVSEMDSKQFFEDLYNTRAITLRRYVRQALQTFTRREDSIRAAMDHSVSNGPIEGLNNKIKVIKRTGYGYRNFWRFRTRVFLCFELHRARKIRKTRLYNKRKSQREKRQQRNLSVVA